MVCPNCGAEVPERAKACPECGSDEQTGWSEAAQAGDAGLPDDEFHYEEFVEREFGGKTPVPRGIRWYWWLVALLLVIGFFLLWFR